MSASEGTQAIQQQDLKQRFTYMSEPISGKPQQTVQQLQETLQSAAQELVSQLPASRETSMAVSKIEEAQLWAFKAAISQGQSGQSR